MTNNSQLSNEKMLTVHNVARRLGVSDEHCRRLIRYGRLEACNVSTGVRPVYRISETAIAKFFSENASEN